jgi:hypothetical protein
VAIFYRFDDSMLFKKMPWKQVCDSQASKTTIGFPITCTLSVSRRLLLFHLSCLTYLLHFEKNKSRLMRTPCCLFACVSP